LDKKLYEKKISSRQIFNGAILGLSFDKVKLPNGKIVSREKITHPGAVAVVAVTDEHEILLVRQFRYPVNDITIEIPAGKLDRDELPENCAKRELAEEVGAFNGVLRLLSSFYTTPGFCDEVLHLFMATGFKMSNNSPDEDEFLDIIKIKMETALLWIKEGKIKDSKTIIGILMARDLLSNGQ